MSNQKIVCKIYFVDTGTSTIKQIIGQVDKAQLFSALNYFIEVKNCKHTTICKNDIKEIVIYEEQKRIIIGKKNLEVNYPLQVEG